MKNNNTVPAPGSLTEILFITSYPPRECGIATYSHDLVKALSNKFSQSFTMDICALESESEKHIYTDSSLPGSTEIKYILNIDEPDGFSHLAKSINDNVAIRMVMVQHEFGFFKKREDDFREFLKVLIKPIVIVFHTVLPHPDDSLKTNVQEISGIVESIIVMTHSSAEVLINDYAVLREKITVIPHGTHLVPHVAKDILKDKYKLGRKKILSTFGLLNPGKSIETTLEALPAIIKENPDVLFLIIGKTHPSLVKQEGEKYRQMLEAKVASLDLGQYVLFINYFLPLPDLLEYLQLTDIYLFTSRDPNQAVSGTFSYAISSGCPVISTPIPHAREILRNDAGIIVDFENSHQLGEAVITLLKDEQLRKNISSNGLHRMASTAWENAAIAHALLFEKISDVQIQLQFDRPAINLDHIRKLTTTFGMIQFARLNQPDSDSGYTLDDNARALIAMCQHYELTREEADIKYIIIYFNFIKYCFQPGGNFLNYVDKQSVFTGQNNLTNLADANGRAIWALGYLISVSDVLPEALELLREEALSILQKALLNINKIHSTRAMAFIIKGVYYYNTKMQSASATALIAEFANRLAAMYVHEAEEDWKWFESYLTYANSILPEAMLCAWLATGIPVYKNIAKTSFDFLLSKTFHDDRIKVISNKNWLHKGKMPAAEAPGGEQPIDVAYTILALGKFHDVFDDKESRHKMEIAFNWFLGNNHLHQIIYNPCTGGCYDGLEENYVNLNQGAESTVSYLMARLSIEKYFGEEQNNFSAKPTARQKKYFSELGVQY